jgi:hypothetical protein
VQEAKNDVSNISLLASVPLRVIADVKLLRHMGWQIVGVTQRNVKHILLHCVFNPNLNLGPFGEIHGLSVIFVTITKQTVQLIKNTLLRFFNSELEFTLLEWYLADQWQGTVIPIETPEAEAEIRDSRGDDLIMHANDLFSKHRDDHGSIAVGLVNVEFVHP